MHYTAFVPYSVTAGCSLTPQHSRSTACALLSDYGYLLIQAFFQALQSYSWGFALIQSLSELLSGLVMASANLLTIYLLLLLCGSGYIRATQLTGVISTPPVLNKLQT